MENNQERVDGGYRGEGNFSQDEGLGCSKKRLRVPNPDSSFIFTQSQLRPQPPSFLNLTRLLFVCGSELGWKCSRRLYLIHWTRNPESVQRSRVNKGSPKNKETLHWQTASSAFYISSTNKVLKPAMGMRTHTPDRPHHASGRLQNSLTRGRCSKRDANGLNNFLIVC